MKGELAVWFGCSWVWMWAGAGHLLLLLLLLLPVAPILTQAPLVLRIHLQKVYGKIVSKMHSWASASRPMPPPLAFRHPVSELMPEHSGTELSPLIPVWTDPASAFLFIPVPDWLNAGQSDIPALTKKSTPRTSTLQTGSGKWYTLYAHRRLLLVLWMLYDVEKSYVRYRWSRISPALTNYGKMVRYLTNYFFMQFDLFSVTT